MHDETERPTSNEPTAAVYDPPPGLDAAVGELPLAEGEAPRRIGYLVNYSFHIWYQIVMELVRRRAAQYGAELTIRDAHLSVERQIEQARELLDEVDALILTPAATSGLEPIVAMARERGVPLVVEANPVEGMTTLVAICDYDAGHSLGRWIGENVHPPSDAPLRVLDVALPTLRPCLLRSEGFADGLRELQPDAVVVARVNGEGDPNIAHREASGAFAEHGQVDVIFAMDDETGHGAYKAYVDAGLDPAGVTVAGFGLAGDHEKDWLMADGALAVSAAMFPEYVGVRCVDGVVRIATGAKVPRRDVIPTLPMTPESLPDYYTRGENGIWTPNFRAIAALPARETCTRE